MADSTSSVGNTNEQKFADLPPSAKLVFIVLDHEDMITQKQLVEKTRLSNRTVHYALGQLKEINAINEHMNLKDARQSLYTTAYSPTLTKTS